MSTKTPTPGLHARELMFSPADVQRLEDVKEMYSLLLGRSVSNSDAVPPRRCPAGQASDEDRSQAHRREP